MPEAFQKVAPDAEGSGPREGLDDCDAVGLDGWAFLAKDEVGDELAVLGEPGNGGVF